MQFKGVLLVHGPLLLLLLVLLLPSPLGAVAASSSSSPLASVSGDRAAAAEVEEEALARDEQCGQSAEMGREGSCALSTLQRRSQQQPAGGRDQESGERATAEVGGSSSGAIVGAATAAPESQKVATVVPDVVSTEDWGGCPAHPETKTCLLYRECQGPAFCVLGGYMIVPGFYAAGMESINAGNAASFDYLMAAARDKCSSTSCVLITNPVHHRTQDQLHIHYRYMSRWGGRALKRRLEHALCGTSGWQHFSKCGDGKARLYDGFPGVFSAVAAAYPGPNLEHVGITVWFTTACGGYKTMLLATTHCSIEHGITR